MSSYETFKRGCNQDIRYSSDYKPTINVPRNRMLIPNRKRTQDRVHHDSITTTNRITSGSSGQSNQSYWNYGSRTQNIKREPRSTDSKTGNIYL